MIEFKTVKPGFSNIRKNSLPEIMSQLRKSNLNLKFHFIFNNKKVWSEVGGISEFIGTIEEV